MKLVSGKMPGGPGARVGHEKAAVGRGPHLNGIAGIGTLKVRDVWGGGILRTSFSRIVQLVEGLQAVGQLQCVEGSGRSALLLAIVHDGDPRLDALEQGGT